MMLLELHRNGRTTTLNTPIIINTALFTLILLGFSSAQVVLLDDFNRDTSDDYRSITFTPERDRIDFNFDYGALGIPEAPNSVSGATTGVRFQVNNPSAGTTNRKSSAHLIPSGIGSQLVGKDYRVGFDIWMNANGPLPGGGTGSTESFILGVGWNGGQPLQPEGLNGTYFTVTGEGGSSTDVRVYTSEGLNPANTLAGPSANTNDAYYAGVFPGGVDVGLLPIQGGQDNQTGVTAPGQMAFRWHAARVDVIDGIAHFFVDDLLIASASGMDTDLQGNIMVGYADYFDSESDAPNWSFGIVDNLRVAIVPEPASCVLAVMGILCLIGYKRRR